MRLPHRRFTVIYGQLNTGEMITRNMVTTSDNTITTTRINLYKAGKYPDDIINDESGDDDWDELDEIHADPYRYDYNTNMPRHITQMDWTHLECNTIVYFQETHGNTWNPGLVIGRRHAEEQKYDIECQRRKTTYYNVPSKRIDITCGTLTSPMGALITKDWMKSALTTVTKPNMEQEDTRLQRYLNGHSPEDIIRADADEEKAHKHKGTTSQYSANNELESEDGYDTSTESHPRRPTTPTTTPRRQSSRLAKRNKT